MAHKYDVRFVISKSANDTNYSVIYEWEEKRGKKHEKREWIGRVVNINTIDTRSISIVIDPWNPSRALAFGKFSKRSRIAYLKKQNGDASKL